MSHHTTQAPKFGELTDAQCWELLSRNHVGRLGFFNHGSVDIEPVHYVAGDSWLFVRSAEGTKIEAFAHHPYVAFEIDEIDGPFDWRSVVARGTVYMMSETGPRLDRVMFEKALTALRSFMPNALAPDDPTPLRDHLYGIHVDRVTGRTARPRPAMPSGA